MTLRGMLYRARRRIAVFKKYKRWRAKRLSYINENLELRCFVRAFSVRQEAVEELLREKQQKILRLQAAITHYNASHELGVRVHAHDMRHERVISSADQWLREFANDFDARQEEWERTGRYDRRDRVSTDPGPEDSGPVEN